VVNGLFFCATHTSHRNGHTPFVQKGAETSDTSVEAVELNTRCSWHGYSRGVGRGESAGFLNALQSFRISSVIRPERHTSVIVVR